jgi:membrane dipeptidase
MRWIRLGLLALLATAGCVTEGEPPATADANQARSEEAAEPPVTAEHPAAARTDPAELHRDAIVVDGHNDLPWRLRGLYDLDLDPVHLEQRWTDGHTDIPRLREGGVDVQFWAAYVPVRFMGSEAPRVTREQIDLIRRLVERYPDDLELALDTEDIGRITGEDRIASMIGIEGGHAIDGSLDLLREYYRAGVRYMTLTHSATLDWVDAAGDEPRNGGLSEFGREVVAEMNRLGMLVDISHVTSEAMHAVLDASRAPVIFSHSSARALADHPRNVPDDVLVRVAENGGVVMVNFFSGFLTQDGARNVVGLFQEEARIRAENPDPADFTAAMDAWYAERLSSRGTVATIVDHIDHIVDVAGVDHVGLGSDFDGVPMLPEGMEDVSELPAITTELVDRGYSDDDVRKILGGNLLRALRQAEVVAAASG